MQLQVETRFAVTDIFLVYDLLETKIGYARGAVLLVGPPKQEALCPGFGKGPPIVESLLAPFFRARAQIYALTRPACPENRLCSVPQLKAACRLESTPSWAKITETSL
jgi:hypothetical protein